VRVVVGARGVGAAVVVGAVVALVVVGALVVVLVAGPVVVVVVLSSPPPASAITAMTRPITSAATSPIATFCPVLMPPSSS
jgi:uncharacterized metal-binding protein